MTGLAFARTGPVVERRIFPHCFWPHRSIAYFCPAMPEASRLKLWTFRAAPVQLGRSNEERVKQHAKPERRLYEYVGTHASSQEALPCSSQRRHQDSPKTGVLRPPGRARLLRAAELTSQSGRLRQRSREPGASSDSPVRKGHH